MPRPDHRCGQSGQDVARPQVEDPAGAGRVDTGDLVDPVDLSDQMASARLPSQGDIRPAFSAQPRRCRSIRIAAGCESPPPAGGAGERSVAAADLVFAVGFFLLGSLKAAIKLRNRRCSGVPVMTTARRPLDGQPVAAPCARPKTRRTGRCARVGVGDRYHRRAVAQDGGIPRRRAWRSGGTDQLGQGKQLGVRAPPALRATASTPNAPPWRPAGWPQVNMP